jgi:hypothetical protein
MNSRRPVLPRKLFWDVNFDQLDYNEKASFIITRVFERGDVPDIREVRRYYGDEKVVDALTKSKWLFYHTFSLAKNMFDLNDTDFKCYTLNQSKGIPWAY